MATKLEEKKASIGYIVSDPPSCGNCERFTSCKTFRNGWEKETLMRCGLHGFATKKMAYCNNFVRKAGK